jgi:hypothetical protein
VLGGVQAAVPEATMAAAAAASQAATGGASQAVPGGASQAAAMSGLDDDFASSAVAAQVCM